MAVSRRERASGGDVDNQKPDALSEPGHGDIVFLRNAASERRGVLRVRQQDQRRFLRGRPRPGRRAVDFVFLQVNEAYARQVGARGESMLRRRASELVPGLAPGVIQRLARVVDTGEPAAFEIEDPSTDGRAYEARVQPLGGERFGALLLEVTGRKAVETALEDSRAWLTAVVNSVDQIIWTSSPDGYTNFFNQRFYEFTGAPFGSAKGQAWIDVFHPEDRERTLARWRRSLATGEPYEIEYRLRDASGRYHWMLGRGQPVRNEAGEIIRWIGTCSDIHAQKELAEHFRQLHKAHPSVHLVLAPDLTIEEASGPYLRATMTRREDLVGRKLSEVFPVNPDDPAATQVRNLMRASLERVLKAGAPDRVSVQKYDIRRPDGAFEVRWWSCLNVPVFGQDGEVRHILHEVEDLTGEMLERQKAAEARVGEARFRAVAETLPGLVYEADAATRLTYVNSRMLAYSGQTFEGWEDFRTRFIHPDDQARAEVLVADALRNPRTHQMELRLRRADGAYRWFLMATSPLRDAEGRVGKWIGVATDITEQRETAELQRTLLQEVSHRVKNNLAIISSLLRMQARALEGAPRLALEQASLRVQAVAQVHDLLWRAKATREIDLGAFLSDLCTAIASFFPGHETAFRFDPAVADTDMAVPLGLLLNELLTNAYKYAYPEGAGGEVRVGGTREPDGRYRLEVADSGAGLPPGFDLAAARDSLGMKVITSLSAQLGGELTAGSAEPGARFTLVFPLEPGGGLATPA
jgi:PAS domain S-box-containing protein